MEDRQWLAAEQGGEIRPVPQQRIMDKVDECMNRKDYAGVERVLKYWLQEAQVGRDLRGSTESVLRTSTRRLRGSMWFDLFHSSIFQC